MEQITKILTSVVSDVFAACGYESRLGGVTASDRPELCQFQCNGAFGAAKTAHKPPFVVAEEIAEKLRGDDRFEKVEVARPGFLNLTLSDAWLTELVNASAADGCDGVPSLLAGERILVDYGGANVAKPLHIGHLRSAIIGESLKRLALACGAEAIGDVHLGDWGLQIGLVLAELSERYPDRRCFAPDFDAAKDPVETTDVNELSEVYPFASARSKTDKAFSEKAHAMTKELQAGRAGYLAVWKEILRVSVADLKKNYDALNVHFEWWKGESDSEAYVPELLRILEDKHLLYESCGAKVVDVVEETDKNPMPPVIIKKSDDSNIYATTDLATILQRERDFHPDRIWYVVDNRQSLHFTQVFRCARLAGLVPARTELAHCGFGTMNGKDGKPYKTRDGGVMRLEDLIRTVEDAAYEKLSSSDYVSEADKRETARRVGVAAVKFGDLINQRSKDYIFDLEKFLSFEGKTGTYLLYTVTRIRSILRRVGEGKETVSGVYSDSERELYLRLLLTGESYARAVEEKAPNYICENAYALATAFSRFYHENRILDEPDEAKRASWIGLISIVRRFLVKALDILAIEPVENM